MDGIVGENDWYTMRQKGTSKDQGCDSEDVCEAGDDVWAVEN